MTSQAGEPPDGHRLFAVGPSGRVPIVQPTLRPYWGKLPPDKNAEGMNVARRNAVRRSAPFRPFT